MANLKSLAKDTAIYGLSSIAARFVGYLLVPIETAKFSAEDGQYGIITNIYAYVALLLIVLTYGLETTFFRFMNRPGEQPEKVYATALRMVALTSVCFVALVALFLSPISDVVGYPDHHEFIMIMATCVAVDAFINIPMAYLRYAHRPIKFVTLRMISIVVNIIGVLLYLVVLPYFRLNLFGIYDANFSLNVVGVFWIELAGSVLTLFFLGKELSGFRNPFDKATCKRMLKYTWPLLVMGVAGQLNQSASQIIFPWMYDGSAQDARTELGIYGACIKLAMIMVIITQAFRYAYEPFVFSQTKEQDNKKTYAKAMKFYIIFTLLAFLCVMGYMDILRYIVGKSYWEGLQIVPIVMAAEIMFGIFFNLSFWYKLIDKTIWGAYFSGIGAVILIGVDVLLIPKFGYWACAWAGFASYAVSMLLSYRLGQKYYPIRYPLKDIAIYTLVALVLFALITLSNAQLPMIAALAINTLLILCFAFVIIKRDLPLSSLVKIKDKFKK